MVLNKIGNYNKSYESAKLERWENVKDKDQNYEISKLYSPDKKKNVYYVDKEDKNNVYQGNVAYETKSEARKSMFKQMEKEDFEKLSGDETPNRWNK